MLCHLIESKFLNLQNHSLKSEFGLTHYIDMGSRAQKGEAYGIIQGENATTLSLFADRETGLERIICCHSCFGSGGQ